MSSPLKECKIEEEEDEEAEGEEEESPQATLKCPQCNLRFHCLLTLDNHIRFHTKEHPYECSKCHESFRIKKDHKKHVNGQGGCEQNSLLYPVIGKPAVEALTEEAPNDNTCSDCDKSFATAYGLLRHTRLHTGERPFECVECDKTFIDSGDLSKHMKKFHEGETSLQCDVCQKICISKRRLEEHMFKHNGQKRYRCTVCHKDCKCKSHLDEHLRSHSKEKPFKCSLCNISYGYKSQLREHNLTKHSSDVPSIKCKNSDKLIAASQVECDVCGTILSRMSLRHHKLLHKEKRYKCDECEKSFISKYRLVVHQRGHTGERPFICGVPGCGKGMTTKDGLIRHMLIHNGKKDYKCPHCSREFYYTSNLNQHVRTHGGPDSKRFSCAHCHKTFSRQSMLKRHESRPCTGLYFTKPKGQLVNPITTFHGSASADQQPFQELISQEGYIVVERSNTTPNTSSDCMMANKNPLQDTIVGPTHAMTIETPTPVVLVETPAWPPSENYDNAEEFHQFQEVKTEQKYVYVAKPPKQPSLLGQAMEQQWESTSEVQASVVPPATNWPSSNKANAEVQTDNNWNYEVKSSVSEGIWNPDPATTTTVLHRIANNTIEVQHPSDIVLSEDDLSNLMTLAGVSSDTEAHISQANDIVFVTFGEESVKIHTNKNLSEETEAPEAEAHAEDESNEEILESINSPEADESGSESLVEPKEEEAVEDDSDSTELDSMDGTYIPAITYECLHCAEIYKFHYEIEEHCLVSHPGKDVYKCHDCELTFESTRALMKHSVTHNGDSCTQCKVCSKMFTHPQKLTNHMARHTGEKPKRFKCDQCPRRFQDSTHLRDHLMVHSGDKPFSCDECGHKFVRKRDLETHNRIHTGEMPYKCKTCNKTFRALGYLRNHAMVHAETKPFQCTECNKGYIKRSKLALHMLNHTGNKPFKCVEPGCDKSYSDKREFKHHQMRHKGEKPHECSVCGKAFTMRSNMLQHERTHFK